MSKIASEYINLYKLCESRYAKDEIGYNLLTSFIFNVNDIDLDDYLDSIKILYFFDKDFFYRYPYFKKSILWEKSLTTEKPIDFYNFAIKAFPHHYHYLKYNAKKFLVVIDKVKKLLNDLKNGVYDEKYKELENKKCIVCFDNKKSQAFTGCGHMCLCDSCAEVYNKRGEDKCPMCRKESSIIKIYF